MSDIDKLIEDLFPADEYQSRAQELVTEIRNRVGHSLFDRLVDPYSMTAKDYANPNVRLIEGQLTQYHGEYSATGVQTASGHIYLAEVIEELLGWNTIGTFSWHVATAPMSFYELEEHMVQTAMGKVNTKFSHAYSDLTGYLWTNESIKVGGHDVLAEINKTAAAMQSAPVYLALRAEKMDK